jgi:hypothetical protein
LTWHFWEEVGLQYGSTLTFADHAGFHCGICYEYPVFDLLDKKMLKLKERPLLVMEKTLLRSHIWTLQKKK